MEFNGALFTFVPEFADLAANRAPNLLGRTDFFAHFTVTIDQEGRRIGIA
jgi:hypothetical protein